MLGFFRRLFGQEDRSSLTAPASATAPPAAAPLAWPQPVTPPAKAVAPPGKVLIPSETGGFYEKDLSSPFWAAVAKMQPGSFVKYESVGGQWHVLEVLGEPKYGRKEFQDGVGLSVIVRRTSTGQRFTMPANNLSPCAAAFVARDGTNILPGESYRDIKPQDRINSSRVQSAQAAAGIPLSISPLTLFPYDPNKPPSNLAHLSILADALNLACALQIGDAFESPHGPHHPAVIHRLVGKHENGWPWLEAVVISLPPSTTLCWLWPSHIQGIEASDVKPSTTELQEWLLWTAGILPRLYGPRMPLRGRQSTRQLNPPVNAVIRLERRPDRTDILQVAIDAVHLVGKRPFAFEGRAVRKGTPELRGWSGRRVFHLDGYVPTDMPIASLSLPGEDLPIPDPAAWLAKASGAGAARP